MARQVVFRMFVTAAILTGCEYEDAQWDEIADEAADEGVTFRGGSFGTTRRLNTVDLEKPMFKPSIMNGQASVESCMANVQVSQGTLQQSSCTVAFAGSGNDSPDELMYVFPKSSKIDGVQYYQDMKVFPLKNGMMWWEDSASYCSGGSKLVFHKGISVLGNGSVVQTGSSTLFAACTNSAPGKAAEWGHPPWKSLSKYEATIRVIRADYCGSGYSYTQEGRPVYFLDEQKWFHAYGSKPLEAVWDRDGAICVENTRLGGNAPGCVPSCSQLGGLDEILSSYGGDVFAVTRL